MYIPKRALQWPTLSRKRDNSGYELDDDRALRVIVNLMLFGLLALIVISFWAWLKNEKKGFGAILGLGMIVSLAAMICGGFLGFLFGIPRSLQRASGETPPSNGTSIKERPYSNNTNLEQISDWLTKIIVGVSLTQIPAIQKHFHNLSVSIARGFNGYLPVEFSYPFAGAIILFFSTCGFLSVYIWAKIYLLEQLVRLEDRLNSETIKKVEEVSKKSKKVEIAQIEKMLTEFARIKNRVLAIERLPDFKQIVDAARPDPIKYLEDTQKERWGGESVVNGYKLEASFKTNDATSEETYLVTLTVSSIDPATSPLNGDVYFFLHDSFYSDYIKKAAAQNNSVSVEFPSFEAFTVGAVCNGGQVKLELDLNTAANCPADYKYTSPLLTYDEVKKELEELTKKD